MNIIKEVLYDWKHWLGWIISAGGIFGVLLLFKVSTGIITKLAIFIVMVIIDTFKHLVKLQ